MAARAYLNAAQLAQCTPWTEDAIRRMVSRGILRRGVHVFQRQVRAGEQLGQIPDHFHLAHVAHHHEREFSAVQLGLGADLHAAAEEASVADRGHQHAPPQPLAPSIVSQTSVFS